MVEFRWGPVVCVALGWLLGQLVRLPSSQATSNPATSIAEVNAAIEAGFATSAIAEANRPTCKVMCGEGSVRETELRNAKSLTLVRTHIATLPQSQQFSLLIHPTTVDRFASHELLTRGINHPATTAIFQRAIALLGGTPLVYDVGANIGYFSLLCASMGAAVVSVEPTPYHRTLLAASLALNGHSAKVTVVPNALIEHAGKGPSEVCMEMPDAANAGFTRVAPVDSRSNGPACKPEFVAKTTTLDSIISQHGSPRVIKVDVEGFEMTALRGGVPQLARDPPDVFILEYNSYTFTTVSKLPTVGERNRQMANETASYFFAGPMGSHKGGFVLVDLAKSEHLGRPLQGRKNWLRYLHRYSDTKLWNTDLVIVRKAFIDDHGGAAGLLR